MKFNTLVTKYTDILIFNFAHNHLSTVHYATCVLVFFAKKNDKLLYLLLNDKYTLGSCIAFFSQN